MADDVARGRPDPDPTVLTTDALMREVRDLKDIIEAKDRATRELFDEKDRAVWRRMESMENHRVEQKQDTQREITKAFDANTGAIEAVEKTVGTQGERIGAIESGLKGGVDARTAMYATVGLIVIIATVLLSNGVFTK